MEITRRRGIGIGVAAILLGVASLGLARDGGDHGGGHDSHDSGEERGGYVMPHSLDGVNPVYHPGIFGVKPQVAMPQPQPYCFVDGPNGWYVDCNGQSRIRTSQHTVPSKVSGYAYIKPKTAQPKVVYHPRLIQPAVAVHTQSPVVLRRPPAPVPFPFSLLIDPRVDPNPPRVAQN